MLIEQVDDIGLKALERSIGDLLDVFRTTVLGQSNACSGPVHHWDQGLQPNLVAITTWSRKVEPALRSTSSSFVKGLDRLRRCRRM